jgi:hypothetical protein
MRTTLPLPLRMMPMRLLKQGAIALTLITGVALADVIEETTVNEDGTIETCGEGDGLHPCRDAEGETYAHADDPNYVKLDSTQQLEQSSEQIRDESPKELEKTIQQIEDDEKD